MKKIIQLRGITWDHPRGYASIQAVSAAFEQLHPHVSFHWDIRSLKAFGDYPVSKLAQEYDLIMLDHPHLGSAVQGDALVALDTLLPEAFLEDQRKNSVGRSFQSYSLENHQWALAVDAAAQVSAYRPDLMRQLNCGVPKSWDEVLQLAQRLPGGQKIGIPLCETDIYCCLLTLIANQCGDAAFTWADGLNRDASIRAVSLLQTLLPLLHPDSLQMNPIQMLNRMVEGDEIVYSPLLFGYSNYARPEKDRKVLGFCNIPSFAETPRGSLLGGVGLAISSGCDNRAQAAKFVQYAADQSIQTGIYFDNAGQPGHLAAWTSPALNARCNNFFSDTLDTLQQSYLRPRDKGYHVFQEEAGIVLSEGVRHAQPAEQIVEELDHRWNEQRKREG